MEATASDMMRIVGNKTLYEFYPTDELRASIKELKALADRLPETINDKCTYLDTVKNDAKTFLNEKYFIHNIGYLPDDSLALLWYKIRLQFMNNYDKMIEEYNKSAKMISPFDLPIINVYKENQCQIGYQSYPLTKMYTTFADDVDLFFTHIALYNKYNKRTTAFYIHEITHSQVDSNKSIYDYYDNGEVLSIFNELLYAYSVDNDLFLNQLRFRIMDIETNMRCVIARLQGNMPEEFSSTNYVDCVKYIVSTLEAFKLLHNYIYSPNQDAFLKKINAVFDGNLKIEELLDNNRIDLSNISEQEGIKRILKQG